MNDSLKQFMEKTEDGVFYIGHASALVRLSGKLILCDPVWNYSPYGEYWIFHPKQIDCDEILDKVDYCVVSHEHQDHWAPHILEKLHKNKCLPIFIMSGRPNLIAKLGKYSSTCTFEPGWNPIDDEIKLHFVKHPYNDVDSAYVLTNGKFTFYNGNDCFLDGASCLKLAEDLKAHDIRIDIAMVPYAFIHSYPFLLDGVTEEWRHQEIIRCSGECLDKASMFVDIIKPRLAFGGGANLYYAEKDSILNKYLYEPGHAKLDNIYASSYFLAGKVETFSYPLTILDLPEYKEFPPMDFNNSISSYGFNRIVEAIWKANTNIDHELVINGCLIDLKNGVVSTSYEPSGTKPYTKFKVNKKEFDQWQNGEITFEEVIGTRRFRYERVPNVYCREVIEFYTRWL